MKNQNSRLNWFGLVWNETYGNHAAVKIKVVINTEADISVLRVVFTLQQEGGNATTPICNPLHPNRCGCTPTLAVDIIKNYTKSYLYLLVTCFNASTEFWLDFAASFHVNL